MTVDSCSGLAYYFRASIENLEVADSWMTPIFLVDGSLPENQEEAKSLQIRAAHYVYDQRWSFKKGFSMPLLTCITPEEGVYVFKEIHEGICINHSGHMYLFQKILC